MTQKIDLILKKSQDGKNVSSDYVDEKFETEFTELKMSV